MKGRILFKYGFIFGVILLTIQGILIKVIGMPLLIILYLFLIAFPLIYREHKLLMGMITGYIVSLIIFIILVYIAYSIMIFLAKV